MNNPRKTKQSTIHLKKLLQYYAPESCRNIAQLIQTFDEFPDKNAEGKEVISMANGLDVGQWYIHFKKNLLGAQTANDLFIIPCPYTYSPIFNKLLNDTWGVIQDIREVVRAELGPALQAEKEEEEARHNAYLESVKRLQRSKCMQYLAEELGANNMNGVQEGDIVPNE